MYILTYYIFMILIGNFANSFWLRINFSKLRALKCWEFRCQQMLQVNKELLNSNFRSFKPYHNRKFEFVIDVRASQIFTKCNLMFADSRSLKIESSKHGNEDRCIYDPFNDASKGCRLLQNVLKREYIKI